MNKKRVWAGMAVGLCLLSLYGCQKQKMDAPDRVQVGVAYYNQSDTYLNELITELREQLEGMESDELEVTVAIRDAAGAQRTQNDQVKELIDADCNVLCVNLVDRADPSEIIDLAKEHDVPIIFFNREPVAEDLMQWDELYYVGGDSRQSGRLQGELAVDAIQSDSQIDRNKDGKIQYVVLEGEPGHQDAIIRTESAVDTLKSNGIELEKLSYGIANWNRAQAQNRMTQMIGQHQNRVELVLANNDDMAMGAVDAYEKLNFTEPALPVILGIDGTEIGLKAVKESKLAGTVYNDKVGQAEAMTRLAAASVAQKGMDEIEFENEKYIYFSYSKVTRENAEDFMKKEK